METNRTYIQPSMKKQALKAAVWVGIELFSQQGILFVVSIILARIMEPAEFGLVAMASVFIIFAAHLVNGGFQSALIQKQTLSSIDKSTAFWSNVIISIVLTLFLWIIAPYIARFYNHPELTEITRIGSLALLIDGISVVQLALLQKELMFRLRAIVTIVSVIIAGTISILLALNGFGVWAIIALGMIVNFIRILLIWIFHDWKPQLAFSWQSFNCLFSFGSKLLGASLMMTVCDSIYQVIIGKFYTPAELGCFQRAKNFTMFCAYTPIFVITQVNFPFLCKIQNNKAEVRHAFSMLLKYSTMLILPLLAGMGASASNIITVLIGEKWLPAVPYLQVMSITWASYVIYMINLDVIKALGRSDQIFKIELYKRVLLAFSILLLFKYGILRMLYGELCCSLAITLFTAHVLYRHIDCGIIVQTKILLPCILGSLAIIPAVKYVALLDSSPYVILILQIVAGASVYFGTLILLRDRDFLRLLKNISEYMKDRSI